MYILAIICQMASVKLIHFLQELVISYVHCKYCDNNKLANVMLCYVGHCLHISGVFAFHMSWFFREICDLADQYKALVFVDESHATGLFGKTGRYVDDNRSTLRLLTP